MQPTFPSKGKKPKGRSNTTLKPGNGVILKRKKNKDEKAEKYNTNASVRLKLTRPSKQRGNT